MWVIERYGLPSGSASRLVASELKATTRPSGAIEAHALPPLDCSPLLPVVTVLGLDFGSYLTGSILTETIFSWPGIGKWLIEAINRRDYPVLQGGTLLIGLVVMGVNLLVDLTYGFINPRIRHTR